MLLVFILAGIVVYHTLNTAILNDLVSEKTRLIFSILYLLAPPLIYVYWYTYIHGKIPKKQLIINNLIPLFIFFCASLLFAQIKSLVKVCLLISHEIIVLYHIVYPILMIDLLRSFYGLKTKSIKETLKHNSEKTSILKVFVFMMLFHSLIFLIQYNLHILFPDSPDFHFYMKIQIFFMIILQYLITWVIIAMPIVIHFSDKKVGLASFKKYEKSSLSFDEAKLIACKLNTYMELKKPYKNPLYSVQDLSNDMKTDYIHVSETLNGLLGQSFNDYINNYRIEEVKHLFMDSNYKKESIISIAFEAGFNSKAAFYSSFKKFTGKTPSQCRKKLSTDKQEVN